MNLIDQFIERFFPPVMKLPTGIYHYQAPPEAEFPYRLHLRIDQEGNGILILNASSVFHLNMTAAEYAYHIIKRTPPEAVAELVSSRYHIPARQVRADFQDFNQRLETMITTPDLDPVAYLGLDREDPYSNVDIPYRLDCALTYQTGEESGQHLAPIERVKRELLTEEWKTILRKTWEAGIPHVIFTGGEPTLRPDLPELIAFAEKLGMVTGLLTEGLRLTEKDYLQDLLRNGLDHMMILLDPQEEQSWEAVRDAIAEDIFITVHLTLTASNAGKLKENLKKLAEIGVKNISLSANNPKLKEVLTESRKTAADCELNLVWDLPVPYSSFNPVALELTEMGQDMDTVNSGAGKAWLYVEPDGDVLSAQGEETVLGNLLTDPWETIWSTGRT